MFVGISSLVFDISQDEALSNDLNHYLCRWNTNLFLRSLTSILSMLRSRHIVALIDDSYCSRKLLEKLEDSLRKFYGYTEDIHIHPVVFSLESIQYQIKMNEDFYNFLLDQVSTFVVLLPDELQQKVFYSAQFYNLFGAHQMWIIPYFAREKIKKVMPQRILSFEFEKKLTSGYNRIREKAKDLASIHAKHR